MNTPRERRQLTETEARALERRVASDGERPAGVKQRRDVTTSRPHDLVSVGVGSWQNPRVRADGVSTRATTVHLPLDVAESLDWVRMQTKRRLSDLLVEAARDWLKGRRAP